MKTLKTLNYLFVGSLTAATLGFGSFAQAQNACTDFLETKTRVPRLTLTAEERAELNTTRVLENLGSLKAANKLNSQINRYEKWRDKFKSWNGVSESGLRAMQRRNLEDFNSLILSGEKKAALDQVAGLYEKVEMAYDRAFYAEQGLIKFQAEIEAGRLDGAKLQSKLDVLKKEIESNTEIFTEGFEQLQQIESLLRETVDTGKPQNSDKIVEQSLMNTNGRPENPQIEAAFQANIPVDPTAPAPAATAPKPHELPVNKEFVDTAQFVLDHVGNYRKEESVAAVYVNIQKSLGIKKAVERPSFQSMTNFYNAKRNSSGASLARAKQELMSEIWRFTKNMTHVPQILAAYEGAAAKAPHPYNKILLSLLRLSYNNYVRERFLGNIQLILRHPATGEGLTKYARLDKLMALDAEAGSDQFLVTFARITNGMRTWDALKAQAKAITSGGDADYPAKESVRMGHFLKRMEAAEEAAKAAGPMSLFHDTPTSNKAGILLYGTAAGVTAYFQYPEQFQQALEILKTLPLAGG